MKPIASNGRNQTLGPHPEEAALFARPSRRMAAGTISLVAVLRDARILRQAQERAPQDEAYGCRYDSYHGNAVLDRAVKPGDGSTEVGRPIEKCSSRGSRHVEPFRSDDLIGKALRLGIEDVSPTIGIFLLKNL